MSKLRDAWLDSELNALGANSALVSHEAKEMTEKPRMQVTVGVHRFFFWCSSPEENCTLLTHKTDQGGKKKLPDEQSHRLGIDRTILLVHGKKRNTI